MAPESAGLVARGVVDLCESGQAGRDALGGMGSTHAAHGALGGSAHRVDLRGAEGPGEARDAIAASLGLAGPLEEERTRAPRGVWLEEELARAPRVIWLDDVRAPDALAEVLGPLVHHGPRWVVSARRPVPLDCARHVPAEPLDGTAAAALRRRELERLGVGRLEPAEEETLLATAEGWPRALVCLAQATRIRGVAAAVESIVTEEGPCRAALHDALAGLVPEARRLLGALARARGAVDGRDLVRCSPNADDALHALSDRGLVIRGPAGLRVVAPAMVRSVVAEGREEHTRIVLRRAERAHRVRHRDPAASRAVLETLHADLVALSGDEGVPDREAVRAALCLEGVLVGRLARGEVIGLYEEARRRARRAAGDLLPDVTLALARAWIARGDHESAARLLREADELDDRSDTRAYRHLYRAHVAAWRGEVDTARGELETARRAAPDAGPALAADIDVQWGFVALRAGALQEAAAHARQVAERCSRVPLPRPRALATWLMGEVALAEQEPRRAVELFRVARAAVRSQGDEAGTLFATTRIARALAAAGDTERARVEAEWAQREAERAREVTLAWTAAAEAGSEEAPRISAELGWQLQIPALRERARRWLEEGGSQAPRLRVDGTRRLATLAERTLDLSRREALWSILQALIAAHGDGRVLDPDALFAAGWSGQRADPRSRRKRVQTAVWTLRKHLLEDALESGPRGYALASNLRIGPA